MKHHIPFLRFHVVAEVVCAIAVAMLSIPAFAEVNPSVQEYARSAASEGIVIAADMSGKIKTVLQMIAVPLLILVKASGSPVYSLPSDGIPSSPVNWIALLAQVFLWGALIMTVVSGLEYVLKNRDVFRQ